LLEIFLAEDRDVGGEDVEELGDDLADAFEMAGAVLAFEDGREMGEIDDDEITLSPALSRSTGRGFSEEFVFTGMLRPRSMRRMI